MRNDQPGGPIRWRMHLPGIAPEQVYGALNTEEGRAAFWAESAIEADGSIHFHFVNGECCSCRVLRRRPPVEWAIEYFGGSAVFELATDGRGGTDLQLTHTGVAADDWYETHAGWLNVLFPLKAWLVHGVDLRNHDRARTWSNGYGDQ